MDSLDALFDQALDEEVQRQIPDPVDEIAFDTLLDAHAKKAVLGPMGVGETLGRELGSQEVAQKIPFAGPYFRTGDTVVFEGAVERLRNWTDEDYKLAPQRFKERMTQQPSYFDWMKALPEDHPIRKKYEAGDIKRHGTFGESLTPTRERDEAAVRDYLKRVTEAQVRGETLPAEIARIVTENVPYMVEFGLLSQGALAQGLKSVARQATLKTLGASTAARAAANIAGAAGAATGMTAVGRSPEIIAQSGERHAAGDKWASAILRSVGDQWVEMFSEQTGGLLTRGGAGVLRKLPFFGKFVPRIGKAWMYKTGKSEAAFLRRMMRKGGFSSILGEIGEERVGTILRGVLDVEDFGAGKDANMLQRVAAGLKQDLKNLPAEAGAFAVMGGGQSAAMHAAGAAGTMAYRAEMNAHFKANVKNDPMLFFFMNPDEAQRLAGIEKPTRKDFENIPGRWSAEERAEMAGRLRELSPLFDVAPDDIVKLVQEGLAQGLSVTEAQRWAAQTAAERKRMGLPVVTPAETETPEESEGPDDTQDAEGLQGGEPQGQEPRGSVQEPPTGPEETGPGGVLQGEGPGEGEKVTPPKGPIEAEERGWEPVPEDDWRHMAQYDIARTGAGWSLRRLYRGPGEGGSIAYDYVPVMIVGPDIAGMMEEAERLSAQAQQEQDTQKRQELFEQARRLRQEAFQIALSQHQGQAAETPEPAPPEAEPEPQPQPQPEPEPQDQEMTPRRLFQDRVAQRLREGGSISNQDIADWSREAFGAAAGTAREAYDAMEAAIHAHEEQMLRDLPPDQWLSALIALQDRLPTQTRRDTQQVEFQQFSTPPGIAGLAVLAAGIRRGAVALEPSAGTGALAHLMRAAGADVAANEIDERRRSLLLEAGFDTRNVDAEFLDNNLPEGETYDVIVMNPPFSATGGRLSRHDTKFGAEHVRHALLRLRPGGRLVAIVGKGMARNRPKFSDWWKTIESRYNVRANIGLKGDLYAKYGTRFPVQIVVIDNTGPTESVSNEIRGEDMSLEEAAQALAGLMEDDVHGRVLSTSQPGGTTPGKEPVRPPGPEGVQPPGPPHIGGGGGAPTSMGGGQTRPVHSGAGQRPKQPTPVLRPGDREGVRVPGGAAGPRDSEGDHRTGEHIAAGEAERPGERGARPDRSDSGVAPPLLSDVEKQQAGLTIEKAAPKEKAVAETARPYSSYVVQKARVKGAKPHPAKLVESTTLASVEPPDVKITLHLPRKLIESGILSGPQIEAIIYAVQAHDQTLPEGATAGFWLGDGTGAGKTRIMYGIVYEHYLRGRKKAVHISAKKELIEQAKADAGALGYPAPIISQNAISQNAEIEAQEGVLFTTYSLLSREWTKNKTRFAQLANWLGQDFDGVILFDEAHKMKNAAMQRNPDAPQMQEGTNTGNMGIELQRMFPRAKVVYASATGASEIRHMVAYERMGLWGKGRHFEKFSDFFRALHSAGLAGFEALTASLKSMGRYVARSISYEDVVEDSVSVRRAPTPRDKEVYNRAAKFWQVLYDAWKEASNNAHSKFDTTIFYNTQQRFFLGLMSGLMAPDVIRAAEKDIAEGRAPIITFAYTGQAAMERAMQESGGAVSAQELYDVGSRSTLVDLIDRHFPVDQYVEVEDPDTNTVKLVKSGVNAENVRMREKLKNMVAELELPPNPLDVIVEHFGPDRVAEVSGRHHRMEHGKYVRFSIKGVPYGMRSLYELQAFQEGKKDVAVFTPAGDMGYDAHASRHVPNKKQRVIYAFQLFWSADQQLQILGRVHRSDQVVAPIIRLVTLEIAGGKRLYNAVCRRLSGLGAATQGEREAFSGNLFEAEDITDQYGQAALSSLYARMRAGRIEGMGRETLEIMGLLDAKGNITKGKIGDVQGFLNRIMVLPVDQQNRLFEVFYELYTEQVERAKERGEFEFGVEDIQAVGLRLTGEPKTVWTEPVTGASAELHTLVGEVRVHKVSWERGLRWADSGFWRNKRSGHIWAAFSTTTDKGQVFSMLGPKGHSGSKTIVELRDRHERVSNAEAKEWWEERLESIPDTEEKTFYLATGMPFHLWTALRSRWPDDLYQPSMKRAKLADGKMMLGLDLPEAIGRRLLRERTGDTTGSKAKDIEDRLQSGEEIVLENTWVVKKTTISGDAVLEVTAPARDYGLLRRLGFQEEIIYYRKRFFVPWGPESKAIIEKLAKTFDLQEEGRDETLAFAGGPSPVQPRASVPGQQPKKIPTPQQILKTVEHLFGFPARAGRITGARRAGIFKSGPRVARVKQQYLDSLDFLVHEVGHGLDVTHGILKQVPPAVRAELESLDYKPEKGRAREGLAEYIRHLVWDQDAEQVAPTVDAWFRQWLIDHPDIFHAVNVFAEMVQTWRQATALERGLAQISTDRKVPRPADETTAERIVGDFKEGMHALYASQKDAGHFLRRFQEEMKRRGYKGWAEGEGPYDLYLALSLTGPKQAREAMDEGVFLLTGDMQKIGPSMRDIYEGITRDRLPYCNLYAYARHCLEAHEKKPGYNPGLSKADAEQIVAELDCPEFRRAAERMTEYHNALLLMLVDAGVLSAEVANKVIKTWTTYVPLRRLVDAKAKYGKGAGLEWSPLKYRSKHGSGLPIIDPSQTLVERTILFYTRATQQIPINAMIDGARAQGGMGQWIEKVPPKVRAEIVWRDDVLDQMKRKLSDKVGPDQAESVTDALESLLDDPQFLFLWKPVYRPSPKESIVMVYRNGQQELYYVHPAIYKGLMMMQGATLPAYIDNTLGALARSVKLGATAINWAFFQRNIIKDWMTFIAQSRGDVEAVWKALPFNMTFRYAASQARHVMGKEQDPLVELFNQMGGPLATFLGLDLKSVRKAVEDAMADPMKVRAARIAKNPIEALKSVLSLSEIGPRLAEFESVLRKHGYTTAKLDELRRQGKRPPRNVLVEAINAANDVTVNFKRMGYHGAYINKILPYWNARLEGTDKYVRTWATQPIRALAVTSAYAAIAAAYWALVHDDDWYKDSPAWLRYGYWGVTDGQGHLILRLPRSHLWDLAVPAGIQAMLDQWAEKQPEYARAWASMIVKETGLPTHYSDLLPPGVKETVEVGRNWMFFGERPIIPAYLQQRMPAEQITDDTPAFTRWLIGLYNDSVNAVTDDPVRRQQWQISPTKAHHFLHGITGGMYTRLTKGGEQIAEGEGKELAGEMLKSGFRVSRQYSESIGRFYDRREAISKQYASAKYHGKVAAELDAEYHRLEQYARLMSEIRRAIDDIEDPDARWEAGDKYIVGLAREAMGLDELETRPSPLGKAKLPEGVKAVVDDFLGSKLYQLTDARPVRQQGEPLEEYQDRLKAHEQAVQAAKSILPEMTRQQMVALLRREAARRGHKTVALSNGKLTSFGQRVQRLP